MNHKYQITIVWSQEDECYLAYLPDFADEIMQPVTHGDTYEKAVANAKEAIESLIIAYEADNEPLPKPLIVNTIL